MSDFIITIITKYLYWGSFILAGILGCIGLLGPLWLALNFNNMWWFLGYLFSPILIGCSHFIEKELIS